MVEPSPNHEPDSKEPISKTEITEQDWERIDSTLKNLYHICVGAWKEVPWMVILADNPISRISQLVRPKDLGNPHQEIWDKTRELWLKRAEKFPERMSLSNEIEAESLKQFYRSGVVDLGDGPIKLIYSSDCSAGNINQVIVACREAKAAALRLGLKGVSDRHLMLIDSQLPLQDSLYSFYDDITVVGSRGIKDFGDSDLPSVAVHEETHTKVDFILHGFGIDEAAMRDDYAFSALLDFLNEGSAMYVQYALMGVSSTIMLRSKLASLNSADRVQLFNGLYSDELNLFNDLPRARVEDPLFVFTQLRDLPGSFIEYCMSKDFNLEDLMRAFVTKWNEVKPEIAQKLGITEDAVVFSQKQTLENIRKIREGSLVDEEVAAIEAKIKDAMSSAKFRPFQLFAFLEGKSDETSAIKDFLTWVGSE